MATSGAGFQLTVMPTYTPNIRPQAFTGLAEALQWADGASKIVSDLMLRPKETRLKGVQLDEEIDITPKVYDVKSKKLDLDSMRLDTDIQLEPLRADYKAAEYDLGALERRNQADAIRAVPGLETAVREAALDKARFLEREIRQENPDGTVVKMVQRYTRDGTPVGNPITLSSTNDLARRLIEIRARQQLKNDNISEIVPGSPVLDPETGEPTGLLYTTGGKVTKDPRAQTPAIRAKLATEIGKLKDAEVTTQQTLAVIDDLLSDSNADARQSVTGTVRTGTIPLLRTAGKDYLLKVETLKGKLFLEGIQRMRGMGALSNAEGEKVQQSIAAINPTNMTEEGFVNALRQLRDDIERLRQTARRELRDKLIQSGVDPVEADIQAKNEVNEAASSAIVPPSQNPTVDATAARILARRQGQ